METTANTEALQQGGSTEPREPSAIISVAADLAARLPIEQFCEVARGDVIQ
jgi:hypothetical protein